MKWTKILAALKANGYKGADDNIEAILAFCKEANLSLVGDDGADIDLTAAFKARGDKPKKKAVVVGDDGDDDADADEDEKSGDGDIDGADDDAQTKIRRVLNTTKNAVRHSGGHGQSPLDMVRASERKHYDRKASSNKRGAPNGGTSWSCAEAAEYAGASMRLAAFGHGDYPQKSRDQDIAKKTQVSYSATAGGTFVPTILASEFIELREMYGIARSLLRVMPMGGANVQIPRVDSGVTVYAPGEGGTVTASDLTTGMTTLSPFKMAALTNISAELLNDSPISFGDLVADRMAFEFAKKEDECVFSGDGSATYFNVTGIRQKLLNLDATVSNIAGIVEGTGNTYAELELKNFLETRGRAPNYVNSGVWVVHKSFYNGTMLRTGIQPAASFGGAGATLSEILSMPSVGSFLGDTVVFSAAMPRTEANSQVCALYGDFSKVGTIGDVTNGTSVGQSDQRYWEQDLISFRMIQRVAISIHDVGNASATAASRVPGPVVGLATASS